MSASAGFGASRAQASRAQAVWRGAAVGGLCAATLGLVEAIGLVRPEGGAAAGLQLLAAAVLAYGAAGAALAALGTAVQVGLRPHRATGATGATGAPALAAGLPFGLLAALLPITRTAFAGDGEVVLRLLSAVALGALVAMIAAALFARVRALASAKFWAAAFALVLLVAIGSLFSRGGAPATAVAAAPSPNVLLVTIDTLRADHVGARAGAESRTPAIDRLAASGVHFEEALSPVPLTCPSHTTMLTGLYPVEHGSLHNGTRLAEPVVTLADLLASRGYRTGAIVSGYTLGDAACGLASRFGRYEDDVGTRFGLPSAVFELRLGDLLSRVAERVGVPLERGDRPAGSTTGRAIRWLEAAHAQPWFLWVHYFDPHEPYEPPAGWSGLESPDPELGHWYHGVSAEQKETAVNDPEIVRDMRALYAAEVAYVDAEVGRLLVALDESGADETLVILTADHGESLGEHDYWFEHSNYLYEEELRVPLVIRPPAGTETPGARLPGPARLVDIAPTVLDYAGVPPDPGMAGTSLRPQIEQGAASPDEPVFAAVRPGAWSSGRSIYAVRDGPWKLIWTSPEWRFYGMRHPEREELYDLSRDPGERDNRVDDEPEVLDELRGLMQTWRAGGGNAVAPIDAEMQRRLRELGYVE